MTYSLEEFDSLLRQTQPVTPNTEVHILRQWRTSLVRASVLASYVLGVLSFDLELLRKCLSHPTSNNLQMLVDELPNALAAGWVGGGWSLSPDASASVGAASELDFTKIDELLELHAELIASDLNDVTVLKDLRDRVKAQRSELSIRRDQLEKRLKEIQYSIREHYNSGTASVDDWLK